MIIRSFSKSVCFYAVLINLSLAAIFLPKLGIAEPLNTIAPVVRTYNIPAGSLHDALTQFSQQAEIKLTIDATM